MSKLLMLAVFSTDETPSTNNKFAKAALLAASIPVAVWTLRKVYDSVAYFPFPGPRGGPWGISVKGGLPGLERVYEEHSGKDGQPVCFRQEGKLSIVLGNADDITEVLKGRPRHLRRNPAYNKILDPNPAIPGIFTANGDEWRKQHRAYAPAFNEKNVKAMLPLITEKACILVKHFARLKKVEEVRKWVESCAVDVICEAALGMRMNHLERCGQEGSDDDEARELLTLLHLRLQESVNQFRRNPILAAILVYLPRWFAQLFPSLATLFDRSDRINAKCLRIVAQRRQQLEADPSSAESNLIDQALLTLLRDHAAEWSVADVDAAVASNVATFYTAGSETTANTTSWLLFYLAAHPRWQARCRAEVKAVLAGDPISSIGVQHLARLPVLRACLWETMRFQPTVPKITQFTHSEDFELRGQRIPPGSTFHLLFRHYQRHLAGVENGGAWEPSRWLDSAEQLRKEGDVMRVVWWGGGPRICPGRGLAENEIMVILTAVLASFSRWKLMLPEEEVHARDDTTIYPDPLAIHFED